VNGDIGKLRLLRARSQLSESPVYQPECIRIQPSAVGFGAFQQ
jgi:hypothetical protein